MKQRAPMKPISAWLVMDPEDGPTYLSLSDEKDLAEMSLLPKRGQYVVPVEIRERPKVWLSSKEKRLLNAVTDALCDIEPVPDERPKPRRAVRGKR